MLESYVEITIKPSIEFTQNEILSALFLKLHIAISNTANGQIGISFPDYSLKKKFLGFRIRVFSSSKNMSLLQKSNWFFSLRDYLDVTNILDIPLGCNWSVFKRVQVNSFEKQRKRMVRRKGIAYEETLKVIPLNLYKNVEFPFINVKSLSTHSVAKIFIKKDDVVIADISSVGYSSYGLSSSCPVPNF
jgi:CRISPR-associated endonuclease Csy4